MSERTPLGLADLAETASFWARFQKASNTRVGEPAPNAWAFGDSVELADELIGLVLDGTKQATAGSVADYEHENEPLPQVGQVEIVTDGSMRPRAVIALTDVRVGPMSSVDEQFAYDEGEGDRSLGYWVDAHKRFFSRYLPTIGETFTPEMATVFQRFEVIYQES